MTTWAVFMDRYNTRWREADGLSPETASILAAHLSQERGWPHYAAPSDTNFDPFDGMTEEEYQAAMQEDAHEKA